MKNNEKKERELSEHCPFVPNKQTEKEANEGKIYDFKQDKWVPKSKNVQALMDWRVKKEKSGKNAKESRGQQDLFDYLSTSGAKHGQRAEALQKKKEESELKGCTFKPDVKLTQTKRVKGINKTFKKFNSRVKDYGALEQKRIRNEVM